MIYPEFAALFAWAHERMREINARAARPRPIIRNTPNPSPEPAYHYEPLDACICNAVRMPPCSYCLDPTTKKEHEA